MIKKIKIDEIVFYRILIGILLLIILVMAFKMDTKINVYNDLPEIRDYFDVDCFTKEDIYFECEYTNGGDLIPIIENKTKYWECRINKLPLYTVRAC